MMGKLKEEEQYVMDERNMKLWFEYLVRKLDESDRKLCALNVVDRMKLLSCKEINKVGIDRFNEELRAYYKRNGGVISDFCDQSDVVCNYRMQFFFGTILEKKV